MKYIKPFKNYSSINLTFVGDIMQHPDQIKYYNDNNYDMGDTFSEILPIFKKSDFIIGNLEMTFNGEPYSLDYPINDQKKKFSVPNSFINVIKKLNFDLLMTANNHMLDFGVEGLKKTEKHLINNKIKYVGINKQLHTIELNIKGIDIVFHNYTFLSNTNPKTFNNPAYKTISDSPSPQLYNVPKNYSKLSFFPGINDIKAVKDKINIIYLHWGDEMEPENEEQKTLADFLIEKGFCAVIGSHSHCPQTIIHDYNNLIAYSLGNFISDQMHWILKEKPTEKGIILNLKLNSFGVIENAEYFLIESKVEKNGKTKIHILESKKLKNDSVSFEKETLFNYDSIYTKHKK